MLFHLIPILRILKMSAARSKRPNAGKPPKRFDVAGKAAAKPLQVPKQVLRLKLPKSAVSAPSSELPETPNRSVDGATQRRSEAKGLGRAKASFGATFGADFGTPTPSQTVPLSVSSYAPKKGDLEPLKSLSCLRN